MNQPHFRNNFLKTISWNNKKTVIVFFPYAGAGAFLAYKFSQLLSPHFDLIGVQLPGRENRFEEDYIKDHYEIYEALAGAIYESTLTDQQIIFWGHSLGTYFAYETAHFLQKNYHFNIDHLIVSGAKAPVHLAKRKKLHDLPEDILLSVLKSYGNIDSFSSLTGEMLKQFMPLIRSDIFLLDTYQYNPGHKINSDITTICGTNDPEATPLLANEWQETTHANTEQLTFPGDHYFLHQNQFQTFLCDYIKSLEGGKFHN